MSNKYLRLWIKAINSMYDHEGKVIPNYWKK